MTLRPDQLRHHLVLKDKYAAENVARNVGVTGNSEQRVRYKWSSENEKTVTGKVRVTRDDFDRNPFFNQYPPYFEGRTEYAQRYVRQTPQVVDVHHWQQDDVSGNRSSSSRGSGTNEGLKTSLVINPAIELGNATNGRPMATSAQTGLGHTVYRETFSWPQQEPRKERFEWLNR